MSFNDNIQLDPGRVSTSKGGRGGRGLAIGGSGSLFVVIALVVISQLTGVDLIGGLTGGGQQQQQSQSAQPGIDLSHCTTGKAANEKDECRMVATAQSLDAMWAEQLPEQADADYKKPGFQIFQDSVNTQCGAASANVGPFYCPGDSTVYLDLSFFNQLSQFGAKNGPLAQEYIVAHEFGHHIQNLTGQFNAHDTRQQGDGSAAVRMELQADCYAGIWVNHASQTVDKNSGEAFLKKPSDTQIADALGVAAAIGDDHLQEQSQGGVNPDSWTHGSSEQRTRWFKTGIEQGSMKACDTFSADSL